MKRVLIVEDDVDAAELLHHQLSQHGIDCTLAHDGQAALRALEDGDLDAIVLDIGLPDISGFDVAREARRRHPGIWLIALTGAVSLHDQIRSREVGIDVHLPKPADPDVVVEFLEGLGHHKFEHGIPAPR